MIFDHIKGHQTKMELFKKSFQQKRCFCHSLIFCGPSGVGKKIFALAYAQGLLCTSESRPCGVCPPCIRVEKKSHPDLLIVDPESTLKIDQIRQVQNFVALKAYEGQGKVVIIDQAERLTLQASNALLKTLEEPPPDTYFILVTANRGAIPATVQSRCQRVLFGSLDTDDLKSIVPGAEDWVYRLAHGRVDQVFRLKDENFRTIRALAMKVLRRISEISILEAFSLLSEIAAEKEEALFATQCWMKWTNQAIAFKSTAQNHAAFDEMDTVEKFSKAFSLEQLAALGSRLCRLEQDIVSHVNKQLAFETFLIDALKGKGHSSAS